MKNGVSNTPGETSPGKAPGARYAIYYTPAQHTALWQLASAWLGRDSITDHARTRPPGLNLSHEDVLLATTNPMRYGFHATIIAPFELAADTTEAQLRAAIAHFVSQRAPLRAMLEVDRIDDFLALVPSRPDPRLDAFAAACVETFDRFRAPLSDDDIARRSRDLTARQRDLLLRWGYPHVLEEFRFHMSLTGPLPEDALRRLRPELEELYAPVLAQPADIDGLSLLMQPNRASNFRSLAHYRFPLPQTVNATSY